jgi:hypothetical protein
MTTLRQRYIDVACARLAEIDERHARRAVGRLYKDLAETPAFKSASFDDRIVILVDAYLIAQYA